MKRSLNRDETGGFESKPMSANGGLGRSRENVKKGKGDRFASDLGRDPANAPGSLGRKDRCEKRSVCVCVCVWAILKIKSIYFVVGRNSCNYEEFDRKLWRDLN